MDLAERQDALLHRHPWETARACAVTDILRRHGADEGSRVADVGCGDGFLIERLARTFNWKYPIACDPKAPQDVVRQLEHRGIRFVHEAAAQPPASVDWTLLLDVLEHVPQPAEFLRSEVLPSLAPGGHALVTVPALQLLYTSHDRQLGHYQRYNLRCIGAVVAEAGLKTVSQGYLFSSLLLPRAATALWETLSRVRAERPPEGVGAWSAPAWLSRGLHKALCMDNRLCLWGSRRGIVWPGLSAWMVCRRR